MPPGRPRLMANCNAMTTHCDTPKWRDGGAEGIYAGYSAGVRWPAPVVRGAELLLSAYASGRRAGTLPLGPAPDDATPCDTVPGPGRYRRRFAPTGQDKSRVSGQIPGG